MNCHTPISAPAPAPRVELKPEVSKVLAAIVFLIEESERRSLTLTQYDLVKAIFFAERSHLNRFGRLITSDNFVAMEHGPVPSLAYDLLKDNPIAKRRYQIGSLPWVKREAPLLGLGCFTYSKGAAGYDTDILSPSEQIALSDALSVVSGLTFGQIRELTHNDIAYKEAWQAAGTSRSNPMSLGLLFDSPNFEVAEELGFVSNQKAEVMASNDEFDIPEAQDTAGAKFKLR